MEILTLSYPHKNIKAMKYIAYFLPIYMFTIIALFFYLSLFEKAEEFIFIIMLIFVLLEVLWLVKYLIILNARIIVDKDGICYKVNAPKWICFLPESKEWSVKWENLNNKTIQLGRTEQSKIMLGPLAMGFKFNICGETSMIYPCQWVEFGAEQSYFSKMPFDKSKKTTEQFKSEVIEHCPLLKYLHNHDFDIQINLPEEDLKSHFQYSLNRYSGVLFGLIVAFIIGFAILMVVISGEHYVPEPPLHFFIGSGIVISVPLFFWLKSANISIKDSGLYLFLVGVSFSFFSFALPLAINKITDNQGVQLYRYQLHEIIERDVIFHPVSDNKLPVVILGNPEYWQQYQIGTEHDIGLRRGGLAFYQLNTDNLREKLDKFYQEYFKSSGAEQTSKMSVKSRGIITR